LKAILADPKQAPIHARAEALLGFAEAKVDPVGRLAFCGRRLLLRNSPTLGRDLVDYTFLYDKLHNERVPDDDVSVWIRDYSGGSEDQLVKRWQQDTSLPWLIAALHYAKRDSEHSDELIAAARQVTFDSPAWPTAKFHAVRLLNDKGKRQEARLMLRQIASHLRGASVSTTNAFRAEQLLLAGNFEELLRAAPRTSAGEQLIDNSGERPASPKDALTPMFDTDARAEFSYLPLNLWLAGMQDVRVPKRLRTQLAQSGFTRAAVLDDPLAADMAQVLRDLKPAYKADMDRLLAAPKESRRFEAVLWIGHHPEASIDVWAGLPRGLDNDTPDGRMDVFGANWWCAGKKPEGTEYWPPLFRFLYPDGWKSPAFLTAGQKKMFQSEITRLAALGGAPQFLSSTALAWYGSQPDDPRLPEALSLAVKSSRFGCTDENSRGPVRQAFRVLHNRFPKSPWTARTPYWYK